MTDVRDLADARIARAVRARLDAVLGETGLWIRADVRDAEAALVGSVATSAVRRAAIAACDGVPGVRSVVDRLRIVLPAGCPGRDLEVAMDVEDALSALGPAFCDLAVDVRDGVVLLTGELDRMAQRSAALRMARAVQGVHEVLSGIVLRAHPSYPARSARPR